jgi:hypothetical protein
MGTIIITAITDTAASNPIAVTVMIAAIDV